MCIIFHLAYYYFYDSFFNVPRKHTLCVSFCVLCLDENNNSHNTRKKNEIKFCFLLFLENYLCSLAFLHSLPLCLSSCTAGKQVSYSNVVLMLAMESAVYFNNSRCDHHCYYLRLLTCAFYVHHNLFAFMFRAVSWRTNWMRRKDGSVL